MRRNTSFEKKEDWRWKKVKPCEEIPDIIDELDEILDDEGLDEEYWDKILDELEDCCNEEE